MTEQNQDKSVTPNDGEQTTPIDLNKTIEDLQDKANVTINYVQEKSKDPQAQRIAKSVGLLGVSLSLTYFAAKRGAVSGFNKSLKGFVEAGEMAVADAGTYAAVAQENAGISWQAVKDLQQSVDKAVNTLTKMKK